MEEKCERHKQRTVRKSRRKKQVEKARIMIKHLLSTYIFKLHLGN